MVVEPASPADLEAAVRTAYAFVEAWGRGDDELMNTMLVPERRSRGTVGHDGTPPPDEFQNIQCRPASEKTPYFVDTATGIVAWCAWDVRQDWDLLAGSYSMYVWMRRDPPGPWLVEDYGN